MIAHLITKFDYYYCSECRIKQPIGEICIFCGAIFSNYEELLLKNYKDKNDEGNNLRIK